MWFFDKFRKTIKNEEGGASEQLETKQPAPGEDNYQAALFPDKQLHLTDKEKEKQVFSLTAREKNIYLLLIEGFTLKEIAEQLGIKYSTVNTHMTGIYRKLNVNTRAELIINYRSISK